jgi:hypothetical protein
MTVTGIPITAKAMSRSSRCLAIAFQTACSAPAAITAVTISAVRCGCAVMQPAPARPRTGQ